MKILITGVAGFIGSSLALLLENKDHQVFGVDNLNTYYDPKLKIRRLQRLEKTIFIEEDISDLKAMNKIFKENRPDIVVNLAAQAGVRYSIENPDAYIKSNINGFFNILKLSKTYKVKHLIYASSSSVYGDCKTMPLTESLKNDGPLNIYAATKKSNELMAFSYSSLFGMKTSGLRFFTVYGPWDRPDMALTKFSQKIFKKNNIDLYGDGLLTRDFTYIDDIVQGIQLVIKNNLKTRRNNAEIFNIGSGNPVEVGYFVSLIEKNLGIKAKKKLLPIQPGDMKDTFADTSKIYKLYGWKPKVKIEDGIKNYADWFFSYYA